MSGGAGEGGEDGVLGQQLAMVAVTLRDGEVDPVPDQQQRRSRRRRRAVRMTPQRAAALRRGVEGRVEDVGGQRVHDGMGAVEGQGAAGRDDLERVAARGLADRVAQTRSAPR